MVDGIFTNGTILTFDSQRPIAQAMAVQSGLVVSLGTKEEIHALATDHTTVYDLNGRTVCPGFIDAHNHFMLSTIDLLGVDCRTPPLGSIHAIQEKIARAAGHTPPEGWIRAWGYNEAWLAEGRHPTRADLDAAAPDHPTVLLHASYHQCVANSRALAAAGIGRNTPEPRAGWIVRDRRGEPMGVLHEAASETVENLSRVSLFAVHEQDLQRLASRNARRHYAVGITRICDPAVPPHGEAFYRRLLAEGQVKLSITALGIGSQGLFAPPLNRTLAPPQGDSFRISGVKFFLDGARHCAVCLTKGAALRMALHTLGEAVRKRTVMPLRLLRSSHAHIGADGRLHSGILFHTPDELNALLLRTAQLGLTGALHAIGNEGITRALNAVEYTRRRGGEAASFRVEHAMMAEGEQIRRFRDLDVAAVVQPRFIHDFGDLPLAVGLHRHLRVLAFRDMLDEGVLLVGSSDSPVCDPTVLTSIELAVTRMTAQGERLGPEQALTVEEALSLYTSAPAALLGVRDRCGSLTPGKDADCVVLSANPLKTLPENLSAIRVEQTFIAGELVYDASQAME